MLRRTGVLIAGAAAIAGIAVAGTSAGGGSLRQTSAQRDRILIPESCGIRFRGYTLTWRARLTVSGKRLVGYRIRYDWKRRSATAPGLAARRRNNEELVYADEPFQSPDRGAYGRWIVRDTGALTPMGDHWVYLNGWFDLPGEDATCVLAINLKSGEVSPLYSRNSGDSIVP